MTSDTDTQDTTTIRVTKDQRDRGAEKKPDGMTWSAFIASEEYDPDIAVPVDYTEIATRTADEVQRRLR